MAMSVVYATINGQIVSENRGGVISYYAPDNLGSTVALLDAAGTVTDTFTYWPYGEIQSHVGSSVTPFTFCGTLGYYLDVLGSQIYVRARYLRQALTRWLTVDSMWPAEKAYAYVDNSPCVFVDPSGNGCVTTKHKFGKCSEYTVTVCKRDYTEITYWYLPCGINAECGLPVLEWCYHEKRKQCHVRDVTTNYTICAVDLSLWTTILCTQVPYISVPCQSAIHNCTNTDGVANFSYKYHDDSCGSPSYQGPFCK